MRKFKVGDWVCFNPGEYPKHISSDVWQIEFYERNWYDTDGCPAYEKYKNGSKWREECLRYAHPEEIWMYQNNIKPIYNEDSQKYEPVVIINDILQVGFYERYKVDKKNICKTICKIIDKSTYEGDDYDYNPLLKVLADIAKSYVIENEENEFTYKDNHRLYIDINGRQTGKTYRLVKYAAKNNITIVCHNQASCRNIKDIAGKLGLTIPIPITYEALYNKSSYKGYHDYSKYIIDNVEFYLQSIIPHLDIKGFTATGINQSYNDINEEVDAISKSLDKIKEKINHKPWSSGDKYNN